MQRTRREAIDEFLGYVGELGDPQARQLADATMNRVIESIWLMRPWRDFQSPAPIELTLTAGQRSYALVDYFARVGPGIVRNLTQRGCAIEPVSLEVLQERYPLSGTSLEQPAVPRVMAIAGICGVHTQPSSVGEALEVLSDSAADTTTKVKVSMEGEDGDGRHRRREFTLNGMAPVAVGTWRWVDSFGKSYITGQTPTTAYTTSAGSITLRTVSAETELQHLLPEEASHEHRVVTFAPKPASADTITIPCIRRPKRLLFDADPLPADWWPAIFEKMEVSWRGNTGEATTGSGRPGPELTTLIGWENTSDPRPRRRLSRVSEDWP